jgi:hypothetical protein
MVSSSTFAWARWRYSCSIPAHTQPVIGNIALMGTRTSLEM